jgi:hypothetical protein
MSEAASGADGAAWRWAARALGYGALCLVGGGIAGGALSVVVPSAAIAVGAITSVVIVTPWAVDRVAGAGLGCGLLCLLAWAGASIEGHRAWVVRGADVVPIADLSAWPDDGVAVRLPSPLLHRADLRAQTSWTTRNTRGSATFHEVVVPLVARDGGSIVAFDCSDDQRDPDPDGAWLLAYTAWANTDPPGCSRGVAAARAVAAAAGVVVEPGADARVVRVYRDEASLRDLRGLWAVARVLGGLFALYAAAVVALRRRGVGA